MGKLDTIEKEMLSKRNDYFADAFNHGLFCGDYRINPDDLDDLNETELITLADGLNKSDYIQKYRDVLKRLTIKKDNNAYYVLLGIENQSSIHEAMAVKNLLYDALRYARQVDEKARKNRKESKVGKRLNGESFLSGWKRTDKLMPVITLTIYYGPEEWDAPKSLHEMFDPCIDKNILRYVPDYKINLIEPAKIDDFSKFETDFGKFLEFVAIVTNKKAFEKVKENYENIDVEVARAINCFGKAKIKIPEGKEKVNMCTVFEDYKNEGKEEMRKKMLADKINTTKRLIEEENFSEEKACNITGISVEDFRKGCDN